jgi:cyclic pyranopterin phosphate synthase
MATIIPLTDLRAGTSRATTLAAFVREAATGAPTSPGPDTRGRRMHDLRISVTDRCKFRCV